MTPNIVTRSFSDDNYFVDNIFFANKYKLSTQKKTEKVIVDIGAHIGMFSMMALLLGSKKVYCFEPFIDNFNILMQNVYNSHYSGRITPYNCGVTPYPTETNRVYGFSTPELVDKTFFDFGGIKMTNDYQGNYYPVSCISLDTLLKVFCYGEKIDILKINIGYAEQHILLKSELLSGQVNSICGELEANESELLDFKKFLGIKGFMSFYSEKPNSLGRFQFWASKSPLSDNFELNI